MGRGKKKVFFSGFLAVSLLFFAVTGWASSGDLDSGFWGGTVSRDFGQNDEATAIVEFDEKVLVGGISGKDVVLLKWDEFSQPDETFGVGGALSLDLGGEDRLTSMVVQDDKIVLGGTSKSSGRNIFLLRIDKDGVLDSSFGEAGKLIVDMGSDYDDLGDIVIDDENRIILAGAGRDDMAFVSRYSPDGELDVSFADSGVFWSGMDFSSFSSIAIQEDHKLIACGLDRDAKYNSNALALRLDSDGFLDRSFADTGWISLNLGGDSDELKKVAVQEDGKIVFMGSSTGGSAHKKMGVFLLRYLENGTPDLFFSDRGISRLHIGDLQSRAEDMCLMDDGRILVAGACGDYSSGNDLMFLRYLPDGSLDRDFSENGMILYDFGADDGASSVYLSDGKATVAGRTGKGGWSPAYDFLVARFDVKAEKEVSLLKDDKLIDSFGRDGVAWIDFGSVDSCNSVMTLDDGSSLALGFSGNGESTRIAISKIDKKGEIVDAFGDSGKVLTAFGVNSYGYGLAARPDGGFYVAGAVDDDFALLCYDENGELDRSFGDAGLVTTDFGYRDWGRMIEVLDDGKIVVAGQTLMDPLDPDKLRLALARYTEKGDLDRSFGLNGLVVTDLKFRASLSNIVALSDGSVLGTGSVTKTKKVYPYPSYPSYFRVVKDTDLLLVKYDDRGILDTSFGDGGLVSCDFSGNDYGKDLKVQNKRVFVAGNGGDGDLLVACFDLDGKLDEKYGKDGSILIDVPGKGGLSDSAWGRSIHSLTDGRLMITGDVTGSLLACCLKEDGSLDRSFGRDGIVSTDLGACSWGISSVLTPDGDLIIGGNCRDDFMLACYEGPFPYYIPWSGLRTEGGTFKSLEDNNDVPDSVREELEQMLSFSSEQPDRSVKMIGQRLTFSMEENSLSVSVFAGDILSSFCNIDSGSELCIFRATADGYVRMKNEQGVLTFNRDDVISSSSSDGEMSVNIYLVEARASQVLSGGSGCQVGWAPLSLLLFMPVFFLGKDN